MPSNSASSTLSPKIWSWLNFAGIAVLFVALRWNNFNTPLIRDEGEYAYAAQLLERGVAPYSHAFIQKPPLVIYSYAFADLLMPGWYWSPRILAAVFVALATALLGYVARLEFDTHVARVAMWLATLMIPAPELGQFPANTEMFLLLPLLILIAVFVRESHAGYRWWHWCLGGFAAVTAVLFKYTVSPLVAFVLVAWIWSAVKTHRIGRVARELLIGAGGAALAAALLLGYFLVQDGGGQLWNCTVQFNRHYLDSSTFGLEGRRDVLQSLVSAWWLLAVFVVISFFRESIRNWFWISLTSVALVCTAASVYGHYYIVAMPFLALVAANGMNIAAAQLAGLLKLPLATMVNVLLAGTLAVCLITDLPWIFCSRAEFAAQKLGEPNPFNEALLVGRRVAALSGPDDFVFVAGSEPQILAYAHRRSPTRFITMYPLMIPTHMASGFQTEAIRDLEKHPPQLIVMVRAATSWLVDKDSPPEFRAQLDAWLKRDYSVVGGFVRKGTDAFWAEPLPAYQFADASLVLYQRNRAGN